MNITIPAALLLIVFVFPAPAHARQQGADARGPWLGCWQLIDEKSPKRLILTVSGIGGSQEWLGEIS